MTTDQTEFLDIVFEGPPGPNGAVFVEVEDPWGNGVSLGEWLEREDGFWVLRIPDPRMLQGQGTV